MNCGRCACGPGRGCVRVLFVAETARPVTRWPPAAQAHACAAGPGGGRARKAFIGSYCIHNNFMPIAVSIDSDSVERSTRLDASTSFVVVHILYIPIYEFLYTSYILYMSIYGSFRFRSSRRETPSERLSSDD